jgi:hypothetical protein
MMKRGVAVLYICMLPLYSMLDALYSSYQEHQSIGIEFRGLGKTRLQHVLEVL